MKISRREMSLALITFTSLMVGMAYILFDNLYPQWTLKKDQIQQLQRQIKHNKTAIRMEEKWLSELKALQQDLRVFDQDETSVGPELLKIIKKIATDNELDILNSKPLPEKQTDELAEMGINFAWEGKLESIVHFLAAIQNQGIRYDVRTLNITPHGQKPGSLKGSMVIHCAYTRMDLSKQAPPPASPSVNPLNDASQTIPTAPAQPPQP
jgi:hypothetical protein